MLHIAKSFQKKGDHVIIVASDADLSKKKRLLAQETIDGIKVFRFKRYIPYNPFFWIVAPFIDISRASQLIKKINQENELDLVLTRNHIIGLAADKLGIKKTYFLVPSIVKNLDKMHIKTISNRNFKNQILSVYVNTLINPINQFLQNKALHTATKIILFSQNMKRQVEEDAPDLKQKIHVISPGVDIQDHLSDSPNKHSNKFVFLILGRLIYAKRVDMAIQAMSLSTNENNCELHIVGDGPVKPSLEKMVQELHLQQQVFFYPSTSDVAVHYRGANCFLMTSVYETFGQTIIEAMSFGLPIIAFKNDDGKHVRTSSEEIFNENENGFFCDFSYHALFQCMHKIIHLDEEEKNMMAVRNKTRVKEKYNWDRHVDQLISL